MTAWTVITEWLLVQAADLKEMGKSNAIIVEAFDMLLFQTAMILTMVWDDVDEAHLLEFMDEFAKQLNARWEGSVE